MCELAVISLAVVFVGLPMLGLVLCGINAILEPLLPVYQEKK